jgi:HlyD family secretion protein
MSATLLIVDDDPLVRRAVAEHLAREGHTIVEAGSVREAHERLTSEIDLALLDYHLPDGTVEAVTTVQVGTQVSGTIQSLHADFNSKVRKGQVVARLDPSLFQTQVDQARATVARLQAEVERARATLGDAQLKLRRARDLFAMELIPLSELDTADANAVQAEAAVKAAEAQVTQARASLNQTEVNLGHTIITAPIDGIVISRNVDVGQTVAASMQAPTLFVIARDLTRMQARASISEADIGRIQPGQPVAFRVDAYPDETFVGTVTQIRL